MAEDKPPALTAADYDAIEAAVMETARGRWFLTEYARRNRHSDTTTLLRALDRIEQAITREKPGDDALRLRRELLDMADHVARARKDIAGSIVEAAEGSPGPPLAERAFEDLLAAAEKADTDVFNAAEHVQEIAWSLRDGRADPVLLDDLNRQALEIYRASNHHALTTNRLRSVLATLKFVESRIQAIIHSWSSDVAVIETMAPVASPDNRRGTVLDQAPARIKDDIAFVEQRARHPRQPAPAPAALPAAPAQPRPDPAPRTERLDPRAAPFAAIDALSTEDKIALFS
ncbi:hypothetical protein [Alsobacter sp. R-9]